MMRRSGVLVFAVCAALVPAFAFSESGTGTSSSGASAVPAVVAPTISLPDGPVVTAPVAPTLSPDTMTQAKENSAASAANIKKNSNIKSSSANATASSSATSASALSLLGLGSDSPLLKALSGTSSDASGLDALTALLGGSGTKTASTSEQETLNKVLELLQKQDAQSSASGTAGAAATSAGLSAAKAVPEKTRITSGGELVRFTVNGYSILSTVKTEVSSVLARDGSFLITGDRVYPSSGRYCTETLYLLCRKTGKTTYRLFADVSQNETNPYSLPYRLARKTPIDGTITGDLLVFRTVSTDWNLDLVIRVINPTVQ